MIHPKLNIEMGNNCQLDSKAYIGYRENGKGKLIIGNNVSIRHNCVIRTCSGTIEMGNFTIINYYCIMHGQGGITIGDYTMLSPNVHLYAQNHQLVRHKLIRNQENSSKGIIIENDCWIGANSVITDGVTIENGAVIGAGSIVTKNIPEYEIWAGTPAKKIGERR